MTDRQGGRPDNRQDNRLGLSLAQPASAPKRRSSLQNRSRKIRALKILLPILTVAILGLIAFWPEISERGASFRLSFGAIEQNPDELVLTNARFHGSDRKGQPYMISAQKAFQDKNDARLVHISGLQADIGLKSGQWFAVSADSGLYNQQTRQLTLTGNVAVFSEQGYELQTDQAEVFLETGIAKIPGPVQIRGPQGEITAGAAEYRREDGRILFSKRVKLRYQAASKKR